MKVFSHVGCCCVNWSLLCLGKENCAILIGRAKPGSAREANFWFQFLCRWVFLWVLRRENKTSVALGILYITYTPSTKHSVAFEKVRPGRVGACWAGKGPVSLRLCWWFGMLWWGTGRAVMCGWKSSPKGGLTLPMIPALISCLWCNCVWLSC